MKYYISEKINKVEFLFPLTFLSIALISIAVDSDHIIKLFHYALAAIILCFWFPRAFYLLNINFMKWKTTIYWFAIFLIIPVITIEYGVISLFPIIGLLYLQFMRLFHIYMTGLEPTFNAHWSTENTRDKFSNRTIDDHDSTFMFVYGILPIVIMIILGIAEQLK